MDQLNVGALACDKAMPDLERLTDAIPGALRALQLAAGKNGGDEMRVSSDNQI
jgi:hypothetical protein